MKQWLRGLSGLGLVVVMAGCAAPRAAKFAPAPAGVQARQPAEQQTRQSALRQLEMKVAESPPPMAMEATAAAAGTVGRTNIPLSVKLAWDPSPDPGVAKYHIYYGVASRVYTSMVEVLGGLTTNCVVGNLPYGVTNFFTATALDALGLESEYSNEVSYQKNLPPAPVLNQPVLQLTWSPAGTMILGQADPSTDYEVQAAGALELSWEALGVAHSNPDGEFGFWDGEGAWLPQRFYRAQSY